MISTKRELLDVISIPTNKPAIREDKNDVIYKNALNHYVDNSKEETVNIEKTNKDFILYKNKTSNEVNPKKFTQKNETRERIYFFLLFFNLFVL